MKIAIYGKSFNTVFYPYIRDFFEIINSRFKPLDIIIYRPFYDFIVNETGYLPKISGNYSNCSEIDKSIDYMFSIGGDGTFLETVTYVKDLNIPIIGINSGRLGFLSYIAKEEISTTLEAILNEDYTIEERTLIHLDTEVNLFGKFSYALNELTVHKKDSASMITVHTWLNDEYINTYWADGLIIATPTGSTAYSLSAAGPIVVPYAHNFIITPIAPHNLTVRPIVIPDKNTIVRLKVEGRNDSYLITLDHRSVSFDSSTELLIKSADFKIKILKLKTHSFYKTLRNKLMWGLDKRN